MIEWIIFSIFFNVVNLIFIFMVARECESIKLWIARKLTAFYNDLSDCGIVCRKADEV